MEKRLANWLALKQTPGVGNLLFKRLIDRFGSPGEVFGASRDELARVKGMTRRAVEGVMRRDIPVQAPAEIRRTLQRGFRIITLTDPDYPPLLLQIPDPPPLLYVHGKPDIAADHVAVVGSRNATEYGMDSARRICGDLASRGVCVVSGMAAGIDTAAHLGALEGRGKTIAVLGSGFDHIYPRENRGLFHQIARSGAVITEFPPGTKPEPRNFPIRNRIISGMSLGTAVVEAARKSGSLITARLALEQNREVFAVPGHIHSFKSAGTHALIKQGAKLVEHAGDIIEEISPLMTGPGTRAEQRDGEQAPPPVKLSPEEFKVYQSLGTSPAHIDELVRKISMDPGRLSSILLQLELKGAAKQLPGKRFSLHAPS
ncbi:DNA protecting protein DprA [Candidatus Desulfarcum epimagneticum]|uniref:DNA protecting protein DprA n=1 Tax=uncultured Desulfobacteraceae bacterium TaxID=218296 RepID=A0A484HII5_9BACT|nr:DNA protecting protein DprA [uncultured Desulfobacteraceae bacterium]